MLDFVNAAEDIYRAFKPYFSAAACKEVLTLPCLNGANTRWMGFRSTAGVRWRRAHLLPGAKQAEPGSHARLQRHLQPAVDHFKAMEDEEQSAANFANKASGYVKVYSFLSQIIPI